MGFAIKNLRFFFVAIAVCAALGALASGSAGTMAAAPANLVAMGLDASRSPEQAPRWMSDLSLGSPVGSTTLAVQCPPWMKALPLPQLQVVLKGAPTGTRVEVSLRPGLPFLPVYLKDGTGRLPVAVPDGQALAQMVFRIEGANGQGQVLLQPEKALALSSAVMAGQYLFTVTNWGGAGDLEVSARDAQGQEVALRSSQGALQADGSGWASLGRVEPGAQAVFSAALSESVTFPVTITARTPAGDDTKQTLYSTEASTLCATPGKDGPGSSITGVINTYYPVTAPVSAGATSIQVGTSLGAATPISTGDLLILIQMQSAQINSTNTSSYGDGHTGSGYTSLNGSGSYEYLVAAGPVTSGAVSVQGAGASGGTLNAYAVGPSTSTQGQKTAQLIRVPQYTTVSIGAALTSLAWNGSAGGVLAFDASGALTMSGAISVDGMGFRGGLQTQLTGITTSPPSSTSYRILTPASPPTGCFAMKGEGIAGTPKSLPGANNGSGLDGYPNGDFGQGAPGNAGGGGNDSLPASNSQNAGGAGGGNGGNGGQGGYAWNSAADVGGRLGALVHDAANLLVLGGGGGAGDRNNTSAGGYANGAAGGGIVMIRALTVTGVGTISASGLDAPTSQSDAAGGGGAGGTVMVYTATGSLSGLSIVANGGKGGDAWPAQDGSAYPGNRHGPGGGGGGGAILLSSAAGYAVANGGMNGITTNYSDAYGSTPGTAGITLTTITAAQIPGAATGSQCPTPSTYITKASSAGSGYVSPGQTLTYTVTVTNTTASAWTGIMVNDPVPAGTTYVANSSHVSALSLTTGIYADSFPLPNKVYSNSTGTLAWDNSWKETGDDNKPTHGYIQIVTDPLNKSNNVLQIYNQDIVGNINLSRAQSLSGYTSATLRLNYRRYQMTSFDTAVVQVYYSGNWVPVRSYTGFTDNSGTSYATDPQFLNDAVDITPYLSSSFALRVGFSSVDPAYGSYIYFDNFEIDVQNAQTATSTGSAPPSLLSGYTLQPGQSVTLTYQVQVNANLSPDVTAITNTATLTADGGINQPATVSNPVLPAPVVTSPIIAGTSSLGGTTTAPAGSTVQVYKDGVAFGSPIPVSGASWTLNGVSGLVGGESITATVTFGGQTSAISSAVVVTPAAPSVTGPIAAGATSISGSTTAPAGSSVQVFKNGVAFGSPIPVSGASWTLNGVSGLVGGESITATVTSNGQTSAVSNTVVVTPAAPTITSPVLAGVTSVSGTSVAPDGSAINLYVNGGSTPIGTASVDNTGHWTVTSLSTTLADGDTLTATVTVGTASSAPSAPVVVSANAADVTPAPIVTSPILAGATSVGGTSVSPAGTRIDVFVDGIFVGTATVQADKTWTLTGIGSLADGQSVTATATDSANGHGTSAPSAPVYVSANAGDQTPAPTVNPNIYDGATVVYGTSTSPVGTIIDVYVDGLFLGQTMVQAGGAWSLSGIGPLATLQVITATATDLANIHGTSAPSAPVTVGPPNSGDVTPVPAVTSPLIAGDTSVSGTSPSPTGTLIDVFVGTQMVGQTTVQSGGTWTLTPIAALVAGQSVTATAYDLGIQVWSGPSAPVYVSGGAGATPAPAVGSPINAGATSVSGTSTSPDGTRIDVYGLPSGGTQPVYLNTTTVTGGTWTLGGLSPLVAGTVITATATDVANAKGTSAVSNAVTVSALPISVPPIVTASLLAGASQTIYGSSVEAQGSTITVYIGGALAGTATVAADGSWSFGPTALATGQVVTATVEATGKTVSGLSNRVTVAANAGAVTPPPVITVPLGGIIAPATSISGASVANAAVDVYADGVYLGTATADASGAWTLPGVGPLANGTILTATATVSGSGTSDWSAPVIVGTMVDMLRSDIVTSFPYNGTTIFTHPIATPPYPSLETLGPNHRANLGEAGVSNDPLQPAKPGTDDDDKFYMLNVTSGTADPDTQVLAPADPRKLIFYELLDNNAHTLYLKKSADGTQVIFTIDAP